MLQQMRIHIPRVRLGIDEIGNDIAIYDWIDSPNQSE